MSQKQLTYADYPKLDPSELNARSNIGIGSPGPVPVPCIVAGGYARLALDISKTATSFTVDDVTYIPAVAFIGQIGEELVNVTNVNTGTKTLTVTRAYSNTTAALHTKSDHIFEVLTEYVWQVSDRPVKAINDVFIDKIRQTTGVTKYTGQPGNSHADFPGEAVVAFAAEAFVGQQYNLSPDGVVSGEEVVSEASSQSHPEVTDGNIYSSIRLGGAGHTVWVRYASGIGSIIRQSFVVDIADPDTASPAPTKSFLLTLLSSAGVVREQKKIYLPGGARVSLAFMFDGGAWTDEVRLSPMAVKMAYGMRLYGITRTITRPPASVASSGERFLSFDPVPYADFYGIVTDKNDSTYKTLTVPLRVDYITVRSETVVSQTHRLKVKNESATDRVRIMVAVADTDRSHLAHEEITLWPGEIRTIEMSHDGGGWGASTHAWITHRRSSSNITIYDCAKTVYYEDTSLHTTTTDVVKTPAAITVGDVITVDADWSYDPDGNYGGVGSLIERCDWVIKYLLIELFGYATGDINGPSFTAAGTWYGTNSYKFGFVIRDKCGPIALMQTIASECRSTLLEKSGEWFLNVIPDTAPAAVKTLGRGDTITGFTFDDAPMRNLKNDLQAVFCMDYTDNKYLRTAIAVDAPSKAKYGIYLDHEIELKYVRLQAMADSVLALRLKQQKQPYKTLFCSLLWRHSDLIEADTISLSNVTEIINGTSTPPMYGGKKFFIEKITSPRKGVLDIQALEWW